ncbi:ABC transporter ATP-binding protein [Thalassobaculum sp.]|uniref:ABC transporter ATP-binding protein n=1 Tax=Thalassobaculum sp. TaxID=2022740 RepID=UPI0032EB1515
MSLAEEPAVTNDNIVVSCRSLTKSYPIWHSPMGQMLGLIAPRIVRPARSFTALDNVSFDVGRGEMVGILGHNGSGKSTLLQMVASTLTPTQGTVSVNGTVSALLELGAGLNPEYTGRENIFLYAAVLGIPRSRIQDKVGEILAFSELSEFIDQPVKHYSSGMFLRLAFSIAISVEPELLIIDEALAVGDASFQLKCFEKIQQLKDRGTTVLLVTHSTQVVIELCDRCLLLDHGRLLADGDPTTVAPLYLRLIFAPEDAKEAIRQEILTGEPAAEPNGDGVHALEIAPDRPPTSDGVEEVQYVSRGASIQNVRITDPDGRPAPVLVRNHDYVIRYELRVDQTIRHPLFATLIKTLRGVEIGGLGFGEETTRCTELRAGQTARISFGFRCALNPGQYTLNTGVSAMLGQERHSVHRRINALVFEVAAVDDRHVTGIVDLGLKPALSVDGD